MLTGSIATAYYFVPTSVHGLVELVGAVDHVIVDEGQEISPEWYRAIGAVLAATSKGITIFHDLNQLGGNIPRGDERRYRDRFDRWEKGLRAIPRCTRCELSVNYRNSREIASYYATTLQHSLPHPVRMELPAYSSAEVVVDRASDHNGRVAKVGKHVLALRAQYALEEIVVVCCPPTVRPDAMAAGLVQLGLPAHTDRGRPDGVLVSTPRVFRGHERPVVVVVGSEDGGRGNWGRAIESYIALSRARDRLIVV